MTVAETISPAFANADDRARRIRALANISQARVANSWLRLASSFIVTVVAASLIGTIWPFIWFAGLVVVVLIDRGIYRRLSVKCAAGEAPRSMGWLVAWTVVQSAYGNIMTLMFWFAPYVPGETMAVFYICGGLANTAATLRSNHALAIAGVAPTVLAMLGLPLAEYWMHGGQNALELLPLVAGLLVLGFGVNLWRSLLASDAAQAQAEAAVLRERQAAAAAAAAKTDMIQRMNDELRTPMTALVGAAEHLRRAATTPQARAHIATLVQAGEVLKLVLDDLSDLDRLENGRLRITLKPVDPRELARGVVSAFRAAAQDKNLELFLDVATEVPQRVAIDAPRVRQVLFNLLANAVRYTTHGGVRVRIGAQVIDADRVRLSFMVADTGAGISRPRLAKILGRERHCAEGEGPGLGLAISLRLARLMGGQINARSEMGQGSVFTLNLDAVVCPSAAATTAA